MTLMISTDERGGKYLLSREFNTLVFASDNIETVAHYYEGCVIELDVELIEELRMEYVANELEVMDIGQTLDTYEYGVASKRIPKGKWYVFSKKYLERHAIGLREIEVDISEFYEEE